MSLDRIILQNTSQLDVHYLDIQIWLEIFETSHNIYYDKIYIIAVSSYQMLVQNITLLKHNYYTDVITFYQEDDNSVILYLCALSSIDFKRIFFHGLLHTIGFNDKNAKDKQIMTLEEDKLLNTVSRGTFQQ